MGFRENLKKQRLAAGFSSARKFAKAVGIPYARYINYEGPKGIEPSFAELNHIARFLHVTTDTLLMIQIMKIPWWIMPGRLFFPRHLRLCP